MHLDIVLIIALHWVFFFFNFELLLIQRKLKHFSAPLILRQNLFFKKKKREGIEIYLQGQWILS